MSDGGGQQVMIPGVGVGSEAALDQSAINNTLRAIYNVLNPPQPTPPPTTGRIPGCRIRCGPETLNVTGTFSGLWRNIQHLSEIGGNFAADGSSAFSLASVMAGSTALLLIKIPVVGEVFTEPLTDISVATGQASNELAIDAAIAYAVAGDGQDAALNFSVGVIGASMGGLGGRAAGTFLRMGKDGFLARGAMGMVKMDGVSVKWQGAVSASTNSPSAMLDWLGFNWGPWVDQR